MKSTMVALTNMCLKHYGHKIDSRKMNRNAPDCKFYSLGDRSRRLIEKLQT